MNRQRDRIPAVWATLGLLCLASFGCDSQRPKREDTWQRLRELVGAAESFRAYHEAVPSGDIDDLLQALARIGELKKDWGQSYPGLNAGLDGWGRKMIYEFREGGIVCLRTKGANGIDEAGEGDDFGVWCNVYKIPPRAPDNEPPR